MKPVFSLFGVSVESEHSLHVVEHIIKDTCSKPPLKVPLMSAVRLLVGPGVLLEVSSVASMPVLAVNVKVLEYVFVVEIERLVDRLSMSVLCLPTEVCSSVIKLVIFSSSLII